MLIRIIMILCISLSSVYANIPQNEIQFLMHQPKEKSHIPKQIQFLQHDFTFVIFYKSTCPHCHKFVPILKDFAATYSIPIESYSFDGGSLDGLQGQKINGSIYKAYFLQGGFKAVVPALYLKNKITNQVYPVLFGEAKPYQLAARVNTLVKHIEETMNA